MIFLEEAEDVQNTGRPELGVPEALVPTHILLNYCITFASIHTPFPMAFSALRPYFTHLYNRPRRLGDEQPLEVVSTDGELVGCFLTHQWGQL